MEGKFNFVVGAAGIRLDRFIAEKCPELSRTFAQKLIREGRVTVNSRAARAGWELDAGDAVQITLPPPPPEHPFPENIPLSVVYEDDDLLVIDKPAGLPVHPAPGHPARTLVNAVLHLYPGLADTGDSLRPGIVHRLDKDTSGLVLVARNETSRAYLAAQFKNRTVRKVYRALVRGRLTPETGVIEAALGRDPRNRKRMTVLAEGRGARTAYRVLEYVGDCTLLEVIPHTGRTHQIRVHLSAIGFPILGDNVYGVKSPHLSRQFLHASLLGFRLPATGEYAEFTSELPPDLARALQALAWNLSRPDGRMGIDTP